MKTQPQTYKITVPEVLTVIPLIVLIIFIHIAILIWLGCTLSHTGTSQIRTLLGRNNPN